MDEKQQKFISWLASKLQAQDDQDLQKKLESLGQEGIKKAYDQFLAEGDQEVPMNALGGKLDYLKCLKELKKGGSVDCGCGGMKVKDKGGKLKMDKHKPEWLTNAQKKAEIKKHQLGGQMLAAAGPEEGGPVKKVIPTPAKPGMGTKGIGPAGYYSIVNTGTQQVKVPVHGDAMVKQVGGNYYDYTGMDGLDYDFQNKRYTVDPTWFNNTVKTKGSAGVGFTDMKAYGDWVNQRGSAPTQVYPGQPTVNPVQGQGQHITGTGGSQSGWQNSPQNTQIIEARERQLKAQSQIGRGPSMHQQGGTLQAKTQAQPQQAQGQNGMQPLTPEQVQNQKIDAKAEELSLKGNPKAKQAQQKAALTPLEQLQEAFNKERLKLKPEPTMTLISKNGETFGSGKEVK